MNVIMWKCGVKFLSLPRIGRIKLAKEEKVKNYEKYFHFENNRITLPIFPPPKKCLRSRSERKVFNFGAHKSF